MSNPPPFPPFPPVPPPPRGRHGASAFSPAVVAIISVLGSAFLVVSYYRIFAKLCTRWQSRRATMDIESQLTGGVGETEANVSPLHAHGLDEALIKKIPIFEYKYGDAFTVETDCPVCLMEFVDKQELRMLPKCAHAFHVPCIDTWLTTHSTCPLCRANIYTEQVMSQFPSPRSQVSSFFGTPPDGGYSPADYSMGDFARFSNGHGRSPAPTLRGLLNYEDQQQPPIQWVPGSESGRAEPGEDSLRLYDSRDYGGDSSSRHHGLVIPATGGSVPSETPGPPQDHVTRTASFKELQRSQSRDRDHKWHMHPARRSSSRRNPFASVRSFSMGTSRRLANALEFLDLEGLRSSSSQSKGGEKGIYSPYEYGITETPDYHHATILTVSPADFRSASAARDREMAAAAAGSSSGMKDSFRTPSNLLDSNSSDTADASGAAIKSSSGGRVKGRSLSFRSPFSLKRSLSGGMNVFSLRHSGKSSRVFSSGSPAPPTAPPDDT